MSSIEIIPPGGTLAISPESSGFAHGYGIFETVRVRSGRLELWEAHWHRMVRSAGSLNIHCPFGRDEALQSVKVLAKDLPGDAVIKLSLVKEDGASKLYIYSRTLLPLPDRIGLLLDCSVRIDEASPQAGHKSHNYLENMLVLEAAHEAGCYDGLRLNTQGQLAEGAVSNLFFLREETWHTPALSCGLLPGVVREVLVQSLPVEEGNFQTADLRSADAVFLTNASVGLLPVDFLRSGGTVVQVGSREQHSYRSVCRLLKDRVNRTAIQL